MGCVLSTIPGVFCCLFRVICVASVPLCLRHIGAPISAALMLNFHQTFLEPGSQPHLAAFLEVTSEDEGIERNTGK